jgi:hypothetical protein
MFKSYALTIRPKNGLSRETEKEVLKYLKKQHHAFAVLEGEDESRHLHGQIWFENPKVKGDLRVSLNRICERTIEDWCPAQKKVLSGGIKIAYNDSWSEDYCQKENDPRIIFNNPPEDASEYYPSEEEQEKVQAKANAVDARYHRLSEKFKEQHPEWQIYKYPRLTRKEKVARFLIDAMFVSKTEIVIADKKARFQLCDCLTSYIYSVGTLDMFINSEEVNLIEVSKGTPL